MVEEALNALLSDRYCFFYNHQFVFHYAVCRYAHLQSIDCGIQHCCFAFFKLINYTLKSVCHSLQKTAKDAFND